MSNSLYSVSTPLPHPVTRLKLAAQRQRRPANAEKSVSWPRKKRSSRICQRRRKLRKSEFKQKVFLLKFLLINLDKRDWFGDNYFLAEVNCCLGVKNYTRYNTGELLWLSVLYRNVVIHPNAITSISERGSKVNLVHMAKKTPSMLLYGLVFSTVQQVAAQHQYQILP